MSKTMRACFKKDLKNCWMRLDLKMYIHLWKEELLLISIKTGSNNDNLVHQDCWFSAFLKEKYIFLENVKHNIGKSSTLQN